MAGFNPDKFLADTAPSQQQSAAQFNPDAFLAQTARPPEVTKLESLGRGALQGATLGTSDEIVGGAEALWEKAKGNPAEFGKLYEQHRDESRANNRAAKEANPKTYTGGEIGAGLATMAVPGLAAAKGAKFAKVLDASARAGTIGGLGFSEGETPKEILKDGVTGGYIATMLPLVGAGVGHLGKKAIQGVTNGLVEKIAPTKLKLNEAEIRQAADRLGIKVTPAMLDDAGFVERLEYTLAKSPSYLGQKVARNQQAVSDKLTQKIGDVTADATNLSPYQIGERFKSGVTAKVGERLDPISAVFNEVADSTKHIPVSQRSKDAVTRNIQGLDTFKLTGGSGKPQQYVEAIGRIENADQVKTLMTLLNRDLKSPNLDGSQKEVLFGIKNKLSRLEENSITRAAVSQAREAGMKSNTGKQMGSQIVSDLQGARKEYRRLATDLSDFSESASRAKVDGSPETFLNSVEAIPSEKIQRNYFNTDNHRQLTALQEKFPEQFELLRQGKLKDIAEAAVDGSVNGRNQISAHKFLKEVNDLQPEAKAMIFKGNTQTLDDIQTVKNSMGRDFNPSSTASQQGWRDTITSNIKDIPTYLQYKTAASNMGRGLTEKLVKSREIPKLAEANSARFLDRTGTLAFLPEKKRVLQLSEQAQENPESTPKEKGPEKWANDGFNKLLEHAPDVETQKKLKAMKNELMKSPSGRKKLISASDLKPGSKAMDKILQGIEGDI
jgi:hypothetical protein